MNQLADDCFQHLDRHFAIRSVGDFEKSPVSGVDFATAWSGRDSAQLGEHTVWFLGREDLLRNKRAAGRLKDLADVERLDGDD